MKAQMLCATILGFNTFAADFPIPQIGERWIETNDEKGMALVTRINEEFSNIEYKYWESFDPEMPFHSGGSHQISIERFMNSFKKDTSWRVPH